MKFLSNIMGKSKRERERITNAYREELRVEDMQHQIKGN
jgi:hypothetical protein